MGVDEVKPGREAFALMSEVDVSMLSSGYSYPRAE